MSTEMYLDIVSLEAEIFTGKVKAVVVTGIMGELGVLPGHAPLLTAIKPGQIRVTLPENIQDIYYISGGILEVQPNSVTILADTVVRADDLDEAAALIVRQNAEQMLINKQTNIDYTNVLSQLAQATAKLRTIKLVHKKNK